ncbi:MAG: calcineurin-like phosphoesterase C-terminal domain-containing protein [Bacteroidales bacterium]|nr:calcineurin-like phosphoesterase C-terminal domain-containing protein [Bacteroidales bacterium]
MKRVLSIFVLFLCCAWAWAQGIGSAKDLQEFIDAYNKGQNYLSWCNADSVVVLTADIDLSRVRKLPQIEFFSGKFDGQGFRLKGWKTSAGFIHEIAKDAYVRNIVIDKSCAMKVSSKGEEVRIGFIADTNNGTVSGCVNYGSINHTYSYANGPVFVGGIVGTNSYVVRDCKNYGALSSDTAGENKEEVFACLGGITGGLSGKAAPGCCIVDCENHGTIKLVSSLISAFAGGITGYPVRSRVKRCINHGEVTLDMREAEDGGTTGMMGRAGGIAGQTKADILRCDNYGKIKAMGACGSAVGGIVGVPHEALVVADCYNYGSVSAQGEGVSNTGGIVGSTTRSSHIRGCINYGSVCFDGVSARARSTAGGILGNMSVPKSQNAGAYVSRCINYGEVSSTGGGNKYDALNRNSIHTAGVVAYAESRPGLVGGWVLDCANYGKVNPASGCRGEIVAGSVSIRTGGSAPSDWAVALKSAPREGNVVGSVKTPSGQPWEGVVVTDGYQCVTTGKDGRFAMTSDMAKARFVYLSIPADAVIPTRDGIPQTVLRIPRGSKAVQADFVLERREASADYTIMMIADPQVKPYGWDGSMEAWHERVAPDAEAFRASLSGDVYCINLGDLVYNEMAAWDDYMAGAAMIQCPTFNVIGNHDYDQQNLFETDLGNICYETYVGPSNYSFDLGDIHYVVLNTILYDRPSANDKYHYGLDDETFSWLQADLSYIPKDRIIVTCSHHNPFKTPNSSPHGSHNAYSMNYSKYLELLSSYKEVYAWNGHNHENFYYNYKGKDTPHGASNIQCISVTRCTGALRFNRPIASMGEPQGYMVLEVHGESMSWWYKGVGTGKDYQMKAYSPARTGDGTVKVNIWNWSEGWSTPEWYEGGVKIADMEFTPGTDPDYVDLYATFDNQTNRKYCVPSEKSIIFSVHPTPGATSGEIRVTDMFGVTYTQTVEL